MSIFKSLKPINNFLKFNQNKRGLWEYINIAFNRVDIERLKLVGPNRLCAEWILKNDGAIKLLGIANQPILINKYNALPEEKINFHIKEIDASNSCIMKIGFEHLKNCNYIDTIILHNCTHMENEAIAELKHAKDSLTHLQISSCNNVIDLSSLKELKNLKEIILQDLSFVKNLNNIKTELNKVIPNCSVEIK